MKEKIRLYIDAMLYGDSITKRYLYGIVLLTLGTVILSIMAISGFGLFYGLGAVVSAISDLIWWQSMTLTSEELEKQGDEALCRQKKEERRVLRSQEKIEKKKQKEKKRREKKKQKEVEKEKKEIAKRQEKIDQEEEEPKRKKESEGNKPFSVTGEEMKYILKKSRAKKDHREVIIDSCPSLGLKESPAYLWKDRKKYYLLVVGEGEPLKLDYPLSYDTILVHVNGVKAIPEREYTRFKSPSFISMVFEPFLPDYYEKTSFYEAGLCKNLYRLGKDMYFTNTSAKNVFDITGANFKVEDEITKETAHGEDFVNVYKANILWRDGVISAKEYKDRVTELLSNLAKSDTGFDDFSRILTRMYEYNLITKAYVEFYIQYRKKYKAKR